MKQNKIYKLICYIWFLVPVLSLVRLSQPMITISMYAGIAAVPEVTYNGFQLLIHGNLVNYYNNIVIDIRNFGLILLKTMIVLQLIFDVIVVFICLWEWKIKQASKIFVWFRGMLSIGYVLTAFAVYQFVPICCNHRKVVYCPFQSHADYDQFELG